MKTWEGHHVDGQFAQIGIQLAREAEAGRDARHGERDQVIKVTVGWSRQLEGTEADVVQRLVVDAVRLVRVLNQLVDGESSVVGLDDSVWHLGRWHDRVRVHDAIRVLFADLGDEKSSHARAGSTTQRVSQLKALLFE